jgi:hypothetical protein
MLEGANAGWKKLAEIQDTKIEKLEQLVTKYRMALELIIKHQALFADEIGDASGVTMIAKEALEKCGKNEIRACSYGMLSDADRLILAKQALKT